MLGTLFLTAVLMILSYFVGKANERGAWQYDRNHRYKYEKFPPREAFDAATVAWSFHTGEKIQRRQDESL